MTPWTRLTLPLSAILLQACISTPEEVATSSNVGASTGSTSEGPGPSTTPGTTMPGEDTMGTQGGTGMETTMGAVDTTAGSSSTSADETTMGVDPSTSGSSSSGGESSSTGPIDCVLPCGSNQECNDLGMCVEACGGAWGTGSYAHCLTEFGGFDTDAVCGLDHTCVYWNNPITETACASQGCATACDCPAPPPTGNAIVTCGEITNPVGMNDCYLACNGGLTCPDGMTCNAGGVCVNPVPELPVYGDCNNLMTLCAGDPYCANAPGGEAACFSNCGDVGDCPAGPPSGTAEVACGNAVMGPGDECYLDCSGGATCPTGMGCFFGFLCLWNNL